MTRFRIPAFALLLGLAACSRNSSRIPERLAILPFENLTGDPSFDWVAAAAPAIVTAEVAGAGMAASQAPTIRDAYLNRATRFLHGYFTRRGGALHFEFQMEDAQRHRTVQTATADGNLLFAMNGAARAVALDAKPFSTANQDAISAWGHGEFERAVALDPDFGAAWSSWIRQLAAAGKQAEATQTADRALSRASLRSDLDRAQIQLLAANLRNDATARSAALIVLVRIAPNDLPTLNAAAQAANLARKFSAAADLYKQILRRDPANAEAMNALGYSQAYAGNLDEARKAFEQYGKQPGQTTNSLDSLGEAYFMNGRFQNAEQSFEQAYARDPKFINGATLIKAAYSRWLAGDLAAADTVMRKYLGDREGLQDPSVLWREAAWLYSTGRSEEALSKLTSAQPGPSQAQMIQRQVAIWRGEVPLPQDAAVLKQIYENTNPAADGLSRTLYAGALVAAGKGDEARQLLKRWPLPENGTDELFQSLVFPRFLGLRRSLGVQ